MAGPKDKHIFVTVGTTSFDKLIKTVCSTDICKILKSLGYTHMKLQIGRGSYEPPESVIRGFTIEYVRYLDSIHESIVGADLVVSHAGAGTVMETLEAGCHLLVVINDDLMDNHQLELASKMHKEGHLYYSTCDKLKDVLTDMDLSALKPYQKGDTRIFSNFLDKVMGYS